MTNKVYPLTQSALYKIQSKKKLAEMLHCSTRELNYLSQGNHYRTFDLAPNSKIEHPLFQKKTRHIQDPTQKLKTVQKRILTLLARIEVPDYLYSATKGRTYLNNASQHKGRAATFCLDIKSFYESTTPKHVYSFFFNTLECSPDVSFILTALVCYVNDAQATVHLPTGGPVSPILSFWVNKSMFDQLYEFAISHKLTMTLYVDDLTFSGHTISKCMQKQLESTIKSHHFIPHKFKFYSPDSYKIITGGAVKQNKVTAPNKLKAKVRIATNNYRKRPQQRDDITPILQGLAAAIGQIEPAARTHLLNTIKKTS